MHILVLGAGGMAGHTISLVLKEYGYEVSTLSAQRKIFDNTVLLDITHQQDFEEYLREQSFDVIVNCVGILIKESEQDKALSSYLNSYMPHQLEKIFQGTATKIIHLSTDCVFSGEHAPYYENSFSDGFLYYDRSKYLGELNNEKDLTFRMSIIGPDLSINGVGLFNWFMKQSGNIYGYTKAIWNGITTLELARGIHFAIQENLCGLYHLVPNTNITKFDLLTLFKKTFHKRNIQIFPKDTLSLDKTLINTRKDFSFTVQNYPEMIEQMYQFTIRHQSLYPHYFN